MDFQKLKHLTEKVWASRKINEKTLGFQVQPGTKWNQGLKESSIIKLASNLDFQLPNDIIEYYTTMDGLNSDLINVNGMDGRPPIFSKQFYSLSRDFLQIRTIIEQTKDFDLSQLDGNGSQNLSPPVKLFPFAESLFVVCPPNPPLVISEEEDEYMVVSDSLIDYLYSSLRN